jgi:hypothetical protein
MDYTGFSDSGLKMMQKGVADALAADDATPAGQAKEFEVREYSDWREHADAIETVLDQRQVSYTKIVW